MSQGTEVAPARTFILFPLVLTFWWCHLQRGISNHPPTESFDDGGGHADAHMHL